MMLIALLAFFMILAPLQSVCAINLSPGEVAPAFTLSTTEGKDVSLSQYKGQIVVLIYWRADQEHSVIALKDGVNFSKAFKEKGVQVLGLVAGTERMAEVRKVLSENEIDIPVLIDTERHVFGEYGIRVYPTTLIISREGKMAYGLPGYPLIYRATVEGYLRHMLDEAESVVMYETLTSKIEKKEREAAHDIKKYNLALKLVEGRLIYQAKVTVMKLIEDDPDNEALHVMFGFLYLETKELDEALREFRKALEINPASKDARTGLGKTLILKGDIDSAIDVLSDAVVSNPYAEMAYYELGRAYELKGESRKSAEMFKKVIEKMFNNKVLPQSISECK